MKSLFVMVLVVLGVVAFFFAQRQEQIPPPRFCLSADDHRIAKPDGQPFLWLADDAWALANRLSADDVDFYLDTRKAQGFSVIHLWAAASWMQENLAGQSPFAGKPERPEAIHLNRAFWQQIGGVIDKAAERQLLVVLEVGKVLLRHPERYWIASSSEHRVNLKNAYAFGWKVANLMRRDGQVRPNLIWGLGGDIHPANRYKLGELNAGPRFVELVNALAEGIADSTNALSVNSFDGAADYTTTFMSLHPGATANGGASTDPVSTSSYWHLRPWLDYNSHQSGRRKRWNDSFLAITRSDYAMPPYKPSIETELGFEEGEILEDGGTFTDYHIRAHAYWGLLSGAAGHQYGNTNTWQMYDPERFPARGGAQRHWRKAIDADGARQFIHLRKLFQSRPLLAFTPEQGLLLPAETGQHKHALILAARAEEQGYAFVYTTNGRPVELKMDTFSEPVVAWWFDPRTGEAASIGRFENTGVTQFDPPGEPTGVLAEDGNDWVLVLDEVSRNYPSPGTVSEVASPLACFTR